MKNLKNLNKSFEILGLNYNTSLEDVKKTYHKLAKQYHPDKIKDSKNKIEAEKKFIEIKKAYDEIIEYYKETKNLDDNDFYDNQFSDFFNKSAPKNEDFYAKYGFNKKNTRKEIISDFEKYVKNNKISQYDIFMAIYKNKPIYKDKLGYSVNEMLMKENIYRSYIKTTPDYIKFTKNISLIKKLNVEVNLYYDLNEYENKPLNFEFEYDYKAICNICSGWGCGRCQNGIKMHHKKLNVKIDKCSNNKTVFLKQKGNTTPWKNGDVKINLIAINNLNNKKNKLFYYKIKNNNLTLNIDVELPQKMYYAALESIKNTYNFLYKHKTHTLYITAIILLVIIIILLACLL